MSKRYAIDLDAEMCISCGACAVACMDQNDLDVESGQIPFRNVFDLELPSGKGVSFSHLSLACMHCDNAPCIIGCPSACLRKDADTGLTVFDTANCIGCHSCAMACPYGVPSFGPDGKMVKCDGCYVRIHQGLKPACVKVCPTGALRLVETDKEDIPRERSLRMRSREMLKRQV